MHGPEAWFNSKSGLQSFSPCLPLARPTVTTPVLSRHPESRSGAHRRQAQQRTSPAWLLRPAAATGRFAQPRLAMLEHASTEAQARSQFRFGARSGRCELRILAVRGDKRGENSVAEQVLAAVRTGPSKTEIREFPMPDIPDGRGADEDGGRRHLRHRRQALQASAVATRR